MVIQNLLGSCPTVLFTTTQWNDVINAPETQDTSSVDKSLAVVSDPLVFNAKVLTGQSNSEYSKVYELAAELGSN